ncbi:MAG TPA: hypothetical protein O0X27_06310 [Methanocorpusculum sp.]|nr:hypothetical protein [Methanocorpusculum sp.]
MSAVPDSITARIIAVDPAVTANATSDETGIVVVSRDSAGHMYLEQDLSGTYTPAVWADRVIQEYAHGRFDAIVAEVNQGGDFIGTTLKSQAGDVAYTYCPVRATQGKLLRAEPVAVSYERGLVHHVGYFPELEDQLVEWAPSDRKSPDRLDALVWAVTYLIRAGVAYGDQPDTPCVTEQDTRWIGVHDEDGSAYIYGEGYIGCGFPRPPEF